MNSEQPHWTQFESKLERYQKFQKEADVSRLLRQHRRQPEAPLFVYRALDRLGQLLVEWGAWLQGRFSPCGRLDPAENHGGC
jgi:hypothetical protein